MWLKGSGDTHMTVFCTKLGLAARPSREKPPYKIIYSEELHVNYVAAVLLPYFQGFAFCPKPKSSSLLTRGDSTHKNGKPLGS